SDHAHANSGLGSERQVTSHDRNLDANVRLAGVVQEHHHRLELFVRQRGEEQVVATLHVCVVIDRLVPLASLPADQGATLDSHDLATGERGVRVQAPAGNTALPNVKGSIRRAWKEEE